MAHTRLHPLLRWARKPSVASEPDFGDHGTAFGLDLSLAPPVPPPAAEPAAPTAPGTASSPRGAPNPLWSRVGGRRRWRDG